MTSSCRCCGCRVLAPLAAPGAAGPDCANQLPSCHCRKSGRLRGRRQCQNCFAAIRIGPLLFLVLVLLRLVVDDRRGVRLRTSNWWQRKSSEAVTVDCYLFYYLLLLLPGVGAINSSDYYLRPKGIFRRTPFKVNNFEAPTFCT
jgi:hypothetical protein